MNVTRGERDATATAGMRQLPLDLPAAEPVQSLASFVALGCPGLTAHIARLLDQPAAPPDGALFWYGAPASGKTHLLHAVQFELRQRGLPPAWWLDGRVPTAPAAAALDEAADQRDLRSIAPFGAVLIDDAERLDDEGQRLAFVAYELAIARGVPVFAAAHAPAAELPLRDDLKTRLAWGHAYALEPLSDGGRQLALRAHAMARGFELPPDATQWILAHWARDMASLVRLVERLDRYSIATKKPVSLSLLKAMLQQELLT